MIIKISDYEHLITESDATAAVVEALYKCQKNPGSTLSLEGRTLNFRRDFAYEREYYISNNDYSKKSIIFPLINMENVTVDGEGATLLFHGEVLPFVIDESVGVTVKNLSIDYPHPYFFQADIVDAAEDFIELKFDDSQFDCRVEEEKLVFTNKGNGFTVKTGRILVCEFDKETTAPASHISPYFFFTADKSDGWFLDRMYRYVKPHQISHNSFRMEGHFGHVHNIGNKIICTCGPGRRCPGMLCNNSRDTLIKDVTMYSAAGMGFVGQISENITLDGVKMIPNKEKGRYLSVNADATHFVNCSGAVRLENCVFTNMLDDAANCHGNYLKYERAIDERTLLLSFGHPQQQGVNIFRRGDLCRVVNNEDMTEVACLTAKDSRLIGAKYLRLEFEEKLPEMKDGFTVENLTQMPEFYVNNCTSGFNRPRGILPSSPKKTGITNNTFFNMNAAIDFTGDSNSWFEAGGARDVVISGNKFVNSAYAGGFVIAIAPHLNDKDTPYHQNILIENNYFELFDEDRFITAKNVDGLVMRNNTFRKNDTLPSHPTGCEGGIRLEPSVTNSTVEPPKKI